MSPSFSRAGAAPSPVDAAAPASHRSRALAVFAIVPVSLGTIVEGSRLLAGLALALLAVALPTALLGALDERTVNGLPWTANVWAKPLKFQLAMALQMLSVAWALGWMRQRGLAVPARRAMVALLLIVVVFEAAYITVQGGRGVASHFNRATPLESVAASLMAGGAGVLVSASAWVGLVALRHWWRSAAGTREPMLLAIGVGFVAMFFLAGYTGSAMGERRGPFVQAVMQAGPALPLTAWRLDIGDLRVAHFFAVHAMQAIPFAAWLARRAPRRFAHGWIVVASLVWAALTLALMQWALANRGLPS